MPAAKTWADRNEGNMRSGLKQTQRITGLKRHQLLYLEERGLIGYVQRSDKRRVYMDEQVERIKRIRALHECANVSYDEAAVLVDELAGGPARAPRERVSELTMQAARSGAERVIVATELMELVMRSRGTRERGDA